MKKILIVIGSVVITGLLIFVSLYFFSTSFYINIKYGKDVDVVVKDITNNLENLDISSNINNYVRNTNDIYFTHDIRNNEMIGGGKCNSENYKEGTVSTRISVDEEKNLILEIISAYDSERNSYLDDLENKKIIVNLNGEKVKSFIKKGDSIHVLTEKNYYNFFIHGGTWIENTLFYNNACEFENYFLVTLSEGHYSNDYANDAKRNASVVEMIDYYNNNETADSSRIYLLLSDGNIVDYDTDEKFEDLEKNLYTFRFGNARIVVNRDSTIRYCSGYDDTENSCDGSFLGPIIINENNIAINVSVIFEHDSYLYIIDNNGNVYREKFDNENHKKIETLTLYSNKKVESLTYVKDKDNLEYHLKELILNYSNGSRDSFNDKYLVNIYSVN